MISVSKTVIKTIVTFGLFAFIEEKLKNLYWHIKL